MKTKILMVVLFSLLVILVVSPGIPAGDKSAERGQGAGKGPKAPPEIESITHIFYRYPAHAGPGPHPTEEADTYHFIKGGLLWFSDSFPVEYEVDPTGSGIASDATVAAVEAGFDEWDDYDPFGNDPFFFEKVSDSNNTVSWDEIDGSGGAVAMATIWYYPWSKEIVNFEIVFDEDEDWGTGGDIGDFDIQNVAAHEVGHVVGLDHVNAPKDGLLTMYRYTRKGETIKRTLGSGDQLGVEDLYD